MKDFWIFLPSVKIGDLTKKEEKRYLEFFINEKQRPKIDRYGRTISWKAPLKVMRIFRRQSAESHRRVDLHFRVAIDNRDYYTQLNNFGYKLGGMTVQLIFLPIKNIDYSIL